jgi:thiamine biosynthesis lipoprotein
MAIQTKTSPAPRNECVSPSISLQNIELDAEKRTVRLPAGMRLDFGGVAKGWAAHQAMRRLEAHGPALVDAGGDIAMSGGQRSGEPWKIAIENPRQAGKNIGVLHVGRAGVATSGVDYRRWKQGDRWSHHIIDPRTGRPAETDILTATIVAPNVLEAEWAAKAVLIQGSRAGMAWLAERPIYAGLIVLQNGAVLRSESLRRMDILEAEGDDIDWSLQDG